MGDPVHLGEPDCERIWVAILAARRLRGMRTVLPSWVRTACGFWVWHMLLARGGMSAFSEAYKVTQGKWEDLPADLPTQVAIELEAGTQI